MPANVRGPESSRSKKDPKGRKNVILGLGKVDVYAATYVDANSVQQNALVLSLDDGEMFSMIREEELHKLIHPPYEWFEKALREALPGASVAKQRVEEKSK